MSVTKSNQNNLTSPNGNSLAVFVDINDDTLKLKDINGNVEGFTTYLPPTPLTTGLLQLQGGVALSSTLTSVTDQNNTASTLKLSTTSAQFVSPLRISTDDASEMYLDCEDGSENNRFNITRNGASQQVNLNFASNPVGSTTIVGAIRTYQDGVNLSATMQFREDGTIFGKGTQAANNLVIQQSNDVGNLYVYNSATWGLLTTTPNGSANTTFNGRIIGTHGGAGNSALALGTIVADTSGSNFNLSIGQASTITTSQNSTAIGRNTTITTTSNATAIGFGAATSTINAVAIGDSNALLQIGGNFTPTARIHVRGTGSTSATTSLLVQNSGGTESLKVQDDNIVRTTYLGIGGGTSTNNIGGSTIAQFGNAVSSGDQLIVVDSSAGTKRGFKFGNQGTIRMALIQDGVNLQIGDFVSTFNPYVTFEYATRNVGFGTTSTNASAKVQIDSTTQGFLPPRMTTAQKVTLAATAVAGLMIYDTNLNKLCVYTGAGWETITSV